MHFRWLLLFLLAFINLMPAPVGAAAKKEVTLIDLPRLTFADLKEYPNLSRLASEAAVGIMTIPLSEPVSLEKVYLGINSGTQLKKIPEESKLFFDFQEQYKNISAGNLYRTLTGITPDRQAGVNLAIGKLAQINMGVRYQTIGQFGNVIHQNNLTTAVIGNADGEEPDRSGALLLIDQTGQVDYAALGEETLIFDRQFPYGKRTDTNQVFQFWEKLREKSDIIVITLGDLERLEKFSPFLTNERWGYYRRFILKNYDAFVGKMIEAAGNRSDMLILYSALPPQRENLPGERLSPLIIKGAAFTGKVLASGSTRRVGIVTGYDITSTILKHFDTEIIGHLSGKPLQAVPGDWLSLAKLQPELVRNYNMRWPLLTGYGYLLIGLFLLGILAIIFWSNPVIFKVLEYLYLFLLTIPAVFLLEAIVNPLDWLSFTIWTVTFSGLIFLTGLVFFNRDKFTFLAWIALATVILIIIDGLGNGVFQLKSFLGYSVVSGARFYGIGNEYMGFLLGAYLVFISITISRWSHYSHQALWVGTCILALFLAHPGLGANIGGGISALLGLGVTNYLLFQHPIRAKEILSLLAAVLVLLFTVALWDFYISGNVMTHFGQLLGLVKDEGVRAIIDLIGRKWDLNLKLISYTPWAKTLILILLAVPFIFQRPPAAVLRLLARYPKMIRGFLGMIFTALIALLFNDSGIVTVATMFIFGGIFILMIIFSECSARRS